MKIKTVHKYVASANSVTLALINLVIAIFFAWISSFVFQQKVDGKPVFVAPEFVKFCTLIVGIITFITAYVLEFEMKMREHFANFGTQLEGLNSAENSITYVGTALKIFDDYLPEIRKAASEATSIRNTLMFHDAVRPGHVEPALLAYLDKAAQNRDDLIISVIRNGGHWVEIFSRNVSRKLSSHIQAVRETRKAFYEPFVMKEEFPVVNFVLFDGNNPEVWFGFGLFTENIDGQVFRTKNPRMISYFQGYFDELIRGCVEWHGVDQENFDGTWITMVYRDNKIKDCAKLSIIAKDHVLKIRGEIYAFDHQQKTFAYQNKFVSSESKCVLTNDTVQLKFNIINDTTVPPKNRQVECFYEIRDVQSPNSFIGSVKINSVNHIKIFGRKLTQAAAAELGNASHPEMEAFLSLLFNDRSIQEQEPILADESPFFGNKFA